MSRMIASMCIITEVLTYEISFDHRTASTFKNPYTSESSRLLEMT